MYYILGPDHKPVVTKDALLWAQFFENMDNRRVAETWVTLVDKDDVHVSTVFLGLDHNYGPGPPLLFETMVFGGPMNDERYRYATWDEAAAGHKILTDEASIEGRVAVWEVEAKLQSIRKRSLKT